MVSVYSDILNEKICNQKILDPIKKIDKIIKCSLKIFNLKVGKAAYINYSLRGFTL